MLIPRAYADIARVDGELIHLFPDRFRDPVYLRARVRQPLLFRDALLALRRVGSSELHRSREDIVEASEDPIITVSEGPVWFEAFSRDESTWGLLRLEPEALGQGPREPGCTNVQLTDCFAEGLKQLRSDSTITLQVGRGGLTVKSEHGEQVEEKVELPRSWLQGFVEVAAAAHRPAVPMSLNPRDLKRVLRYLRGRKARDAPRALRWSLEPGEPPRVEVEPWGERFELSRSEHGATESMQIPQWGRRRLLLLLELLPYTERISVRLGSAREPSFWTCWLGTMRFTLGLSAWSARAWTSQDGWHHFEPHREVGEDELAEARRALGGMLLRPPATLRPALRALAGRGQALHDPSDGTWVGRDLLPGVVLPPTPLHRRAVEARRLAEGAVAIDFDGAGWRGTVKGRGGTYEVGLRLEAETLVSGACSCPFARRFSTLRGPCKHLLAARLVALGARSG